MKKHCHTHVIPKSIQTRYQIHQCNTVFAIYSTVRIVLGQVFLVPIVPAATTCLGNLQLQEICSRAFAAVADITVCGSRRQQTICKVLAVVVSSSPTVGYLISQSQPAVVLVRDVFGWYCRIAKILGQSCENCRIGVARKQLLLCRTVFWLAARTYCKLVYGCQELLLYIRFLFYEVPFLFWSLTLQRWFPGEVSHSAAQPHCL